MTTVGYFSATRELAGMRRYLDDDVTTRVAGNTEPFPRRTTDFDAARDRRADLPDLVGGDRRTTLDKLALPFDRDRWSTRGQGRVRARPCRGREARQAAAAASASGRTTSCSRRRCSRSASTCRGSD